MRKKKDLTNDNTEALVRENGRLSFLTYRFTEEERKQGESGRRIGVRRVRSSRPPGGGGGGVAGGGGGGGTDYSNTSKRECRTLVTSL